MENNFTCSDCGVRSVCKQHPERIDICEGFVLKKKYLCNSCENLGHDCHVCDGTSEFNKDDVAESLPSDIDVAEIGKKNFGSIWGNFQGKKFDTGKPQLSLLPRGGLESASRALEFGLKKYGRDNWRGGFNDSRLIDASLRHLTAFMNGERTDEESGLSHIDHALFSLMVIAEQQRLRSKGIERGKDDLPME